jgi:hypothetical protein
MTVTSPWQFFFSTRTFSNSIESSLTVIALYYWPWGLTVDSVRSEFIPDSANPKVEPAKATKPISVFQSSTSVSKYAPPNFYLKSLVIDLL